MPLPDFFSTQFVDPYTRSSMLFVTGFLFLIGVAISMGGRADPQMDGAIDASVANLKNIIANRMAMASNLGVTNAADDLWVASAYKNIGLMLQSKGIRQHLGGDRLQREALENYNLALSIDKGRTVSLNVQILYLKGMLLKMMGLGQDSLDSLELLETNYPLSDHDRSAMFFQRADTLQMLGKSKEASQNFRKSLQLRPCRTERYYQYVNACKDVPSYTKQDWLDILDEIQHKLKECESRSGNASNRLGSAADAERTKLINSHGDAADDDEDLEEGVAGLPLVASTGSEGPGSSSESHLIFDDHETEDGVSSTNSAVYWALYIAAEKAGRSALAWWYLEHANSLEKSLRPVKFSRDEAITQANQVFSAFTPELLNSLAFMKGKASRVPIFIVGFMRSGSTLLETMLDSHSAIWGMGEDSIFNANLTEFRNRLVSAPANQPDSIAAKQQHLQNTLADYGKKVVKEMRALATERDAPSAAVAAAVDTDTSTKADAGTATEKDGKGGKEKKKAPKKAKKQKLAHIVDKMLFNYRNIGFLHMVFPDALILHTMRDPLDTLFSCFRCKFDDSGLEWSLDMSDLVLQYTLYLQIMQHFRTVLPGRVVDIRYEELVRNPESIMRDIVEQRLKLPWEPAVLDFHNNNRTVQTHSQSQVKQKLYTHSMGAWTRYVDQLEPMTAELRKHLPKLKKAGALPYQDKMNWALDPGFVYHP